MSQKLAELADLVKKVHKAKGRHHSQIAMCDLFDACGLSNVRPGKEPVVEASPDNFASRNDTVTKLNSAKTAAIDPSRKWKKIDELTPRGVKLQLISKAAGVAHYSRYDPSDKFFTHYLEMPTFDDNE